MNSELKEDLSPGSCYKMKTRLINKFFKEPVDALDLRINKAAATVATYPNNSLETITVDDVVNIEHPINNSDVEIAASESILVNIHQDMSPLICTSNQQGDKSNRIQNVQRITFKETSTRNLQSHQRFSPYSPTASAWSNHTGMEYYNPLFHGQDFPKVQMTTACSNQLESTHPNCLSDQNPTLLRSKSQYSDKAISLTGCHKLFQYPVDKSLYLGSKDYQRVSVIERHGKQAGEIGTLSNYLPQKTPKSSQSCISKESEDELDKKIFLVEESMKYVDNPLLTKHLYSSKNHCARKKEKAKPSPVLKDQRKEQPQETNQAQQSGVAGRKESVIIQADQPHLGPGDHSSKICSTEGHDSVIVETMKSNTGYKSEIINRWPGQRETMDDATAADIYDNNHNIYQKKHIQAASVHPYIDGFVKCPTNPCRPNDENQSLGREHVISQRLKSIEDFDSKLFRILDQPSQEESSLVKKVNSFLIRSEALLSSERKNLSLSGSSNWKERIPKPQIGKRGRPRKHAPKIPLPPLYVFIRNLLHNMAYNPSVIAWVDEQGGCFKVTNTTEFARTWGRMKSNR